MTDPGQERKRPRLWLGCAVVVLCLGIGMLVALAWFGAALQGAADSAGDPVSIVVTDPGDVEPDPGNGEEEERDELPEFEWPPPQPSRRVPLGLRTSDGEALSTLGEVAARLEQGFEACGYPRPTYLSAPGGFVLATAMERLETDGAIAQRDRWLEWPDPPAVTSLAFWSGLLTPLRGRWRVSFVAMTTDARRSEAAPAARDEAAGWVVEGASRLPDRLAARPVEEDHQLALYVYEFYKANAEAGALPLAASASADPAPLVGCLGAALKRVP